MPLIAHPIQIPAFEGPLDLLLQLIEQEELDITAISLVQVTDQYLEIIEQMGRRTMGDLTAFLVVAAKLVLIKSRALLPRPPAAEPPEEDVALDLIRQLEAYRRYKRAAQELALREREGLRAYLRMAPIPTPEPTFDLSDVTLRGLVVAAHEVMHILPDEEVVRPAIVTVNEQIERIHTRLVQRKQIEFHEVLREAASKVEVIVTLLAVLQMLKQNLVVVWQDELFGPIFIAEKTPEPEGDAPPSP
ncbi:MAG: segregation/condensation protein A [Anaerolineae bacterium]|nr:segregation/condensation protein A [Anaerolineae bacterium]